MILSSMVEVMMVDCCFVVDFDFDEVDEEVWFEFVLMLVLMLSLVMMWSQ